MYGFLESVFETNGYLGGSTLLDEAATERTEIKSSIVRPGQVLAAEGACEGAATYAGAGVEGVVEGLANVVRLGPVNRADAVILRRGKNTVDQAAVQPSLVMDTEADGMARGKGINFPR